MAEAMTNGMSNHYGQNNGVPMFNGPDHKASPGGEVRKSEHHKHSSSSKDKHKHSSSSHHHSSSSSKHHSSSKHKDGSSSHSSSKHHSSSSSSSKHHHNSSSSSKDPSKHHSSDSKHHSSSSKDPSKSSHSSSSGSSKHHSSSSKHKDGSSSKHSSSKHSSSSSSKHVSGSSSSGSAKPHSGDRIKSDGSEMGSPRPAKPMSPEAPLKIKSEPSPVKYQNETTISPIKIKTDPSSPLKMKIKQEHAQEDSDDDMPLSSRVDMKVSPRQEAKVKRSYVESDEDDEPLSKKIEKVKKVKKEEPPKKRKADDDDFQPATKKKKKEKKKDNKAGVKEKADGAKTKKEKEKEEDNTKWKWWEEEKSDPDIKWTYLEHSGPMFAPPYEPMPSSVKFYYGGKHMKLTEPTEEVATFYGRMLDHDYTTKEVFNRNFFKDWRKVMTQSERETITDLSKCDFREILTHFKDQSEQRKAMSKEEKQVIKKQNEGYVEQYGWCTIDKYKQRIGNFRIEPPGLFRGRGDHPKQGMLKKRTQPEDVIINCSRDSKIPKAPDGHKWKEVRHDNKVTWLACWSENIQNATKYVMLNAASKLKGEKDWKKYEVARNLHKCADRIRAQYREDWKSKEMRIRQRAVAMYFIDKLALRAGNEKDEDQADTVGCCSLRVEHINLHEKIGDKEFVVEFDFLGKDSIRYFNQVSVEKRVFKNLQLFKDNKSEGDDLFDRLNTAILNKHLQGLMEGLTAKVFRTYNASKTLQEQLDLLTKEDDNIPAKILSYNRANRAVAVLCNHQRAAPKNFSKQMENMQAKIEAKKNAIADAKRDVKQAKADVKALRTEASKKVLERKKKAVERLSEQLNKLEVQATDKDENKEIALGTSKLNYLDPRISVAWCKKYEVPIEKVYNKTQREKFAWAIDMAEADFRF